MSSTLALGIIAIDFISNGIIHDCYCHGNY
jgi:hypothetical protein